MKRERRFIQGAELRVSSDSAKPTISGYAAMFNSPTQIGGDAWGFTEIIMPGAFSRALREKQDVRALFNHDDNQVLGRTKPGTLRLTEDEKGLRYEIDPPNTTIATDLRESIQRGDIDGSSFAFIPRKTVWIEDDNEKDIRQVHDVDLIDVSPVTYPAYDDTSVSARNSSDELPADMPENVKEKRNAKTATCACPCERCAGGSCDGCTAAAHSTDDEFRYRHERKLRLTEAQYPVLST